MKTSLVLQDRPFVIDDSDKAKAMLSAFGFLDAILANDPATPGLSRIVRIKVHPTHWLLVNVFTDAEPPHRNSYVLYGWPKSWYSSEVLLSYASAIAAEEPLPLARSQHVSMVVTQTDRRN